MAKQVIILPFKNKFLSDIDKCSRIYNKCAKLTAVRNSEKIHPKQLARITEMTFIDLVSAWEIFLENIFLRYLLGAKCPNDSDPNRFITHIKKLKEARGLLSGLENYDAEKQYMRFIDTKWVIDRSKYFFKDGKPFADLQPHINKFVAATKIRNAIAHNSPKSKKDFLDTAKNTFNIKNQGLHPGELLNKYATVQFNLGRATKKTYYEAYSELYKSMAEVLAP
ncbi:MAG TPA: hypothetical protein PLY93_03970 [Turneriella sp.]|nr:hypothetical protein [Turneriella sp.]